MKTHLMVSESFDTPREVLSGTVEIQAYTHPSPDHPERNEDAAAVWLRPDGSTVLAVADGMGGSPQGARAAAFAIEALDEGVRGAAPGAEPRPVFLDAFESANTRILDEIPGSGTTLVVVELAGPEARCFHVGDSAAIVTGQRGKIKLETIAHSPVGYGVAAGLIDPDEALEHEDRHYLSNHLGSRSMHVEVGSAHSFSNRDTLLLASDGLMDNVPPTELVEIVRCGPLERAAQRLVELCDARMNGRDPRIEGKVDDMTFLLLRRHDS